VDAMMNGMPIGAAGAYPAQDRLLAMMDEMRKDVGRVASDVEVLKSRMMAMESRQQRMEDRLDDIDDKLQPVPTWQTWVMLIVGAVMCLMVFLMLVRLNG
jgi:hypothetical protein